MCFHAERQKAMQSKNKVKASEIFQKYGIYILLLMAIVICSFLTDTFLTSRNLFNIIKQISIVGIICFGQCMLIISGQIDLSSGAVIAVTGIVSVLVANFTGSVFMGFLAGLGFGALCGLINGLIVSKYRLPAFIVTLGVQIFMRGLALQLTNSVAIPPESPNFKALGQGTFLGVPNLAFLIIFLLIFFWFVVNYTSYGRHLYAIGGNEAAAKASGINVNKTKITAFMLSGTLSGLAGFACASRLNVAQPNIGTAGVAFEFDAVIGCVLGGASLVGGRGSVVSALFGCLFVGILNNVLNLVNVSANSQQMIKGLLILFAVIIDAAGKMSEGNSSRRKKA